MPEGLFQIVSYHDTTYVMGDTFYIPPDMRENILDRVQKRKEIFDFEVSDTDIVYAAYVNELNATMLYSRSKPTPCSCADSDGSLLMSIPVWP